MNKSKELQTTKRIVRDILINDPKARNSDDYLYIKVCQRTNPICTNLTFAHVFENRKAYGYPCYESVRRTRQKMQQIFPELAADSDVEAGRMVNEEIFEEFAKRFV